MCEGLQEKLEQIQSLTFDLEVRDITTQDDWFQQYQYEIPVLIMEHSQGPIRLPRLSPRASVHQLEQMLQKFWNDPAQ